LYKGLARSILVWFLILALSGFPCSRGGSTPHRPSSSVRSSNPVDPISPQGIYPHVACLASLGSRVTGYNGCYSAAEYIKTQFRNLSEYGLEMQIQNFSLVVPIDTGTSITVLSPEKKVIKAYTLWPNFVQTSVTPPAGVTGNLVYGGKGLTDFDGYEISDAVILMDFNSQENWLFAADLGAKAVIFIEPENTNRDECLSKFLNTPIHFPRLYVGREDGLYLKRLAQQGNAQVKVVSRMLYQKVSAENIIGIVKGTTYPDDVIIISAHYDTWSVVPAISYGAEESISTGLLIELARYYAINRPSRTVWFVAFSGHWEALAGAREFVEEYFFTNEVGLQVQVGDIRPWVLVNLDLSSGSNILAYFQASYFYLYGTGGPRSGSILDRYAWANEKILKYLRTSPDISKYAISAFHSDPSNWWGTEPTPFVLDSEPAAVSGTIAFSLRTSPDLIFHWGIPINDLPFINSDNLALQFNVVTRIVDGFVNEGDWGLNWADVSPKRLHGNYIAGFLTLRGEVKEYNLTKGWYSAVPHALVRVALPNIYPFTNILTLADDDGKYEVHGVALSHCLSTARTPQLALAPGGGPFGYWYVDAWVVNETDGNIVCAPDYGPYGAQSISFWKLHTGIPFDASTVVFRCVSVEVFNVIEPQTLRRACIPDPRFEGLGLSLVYGLFHLIPYDFRTLSQPIWFSYYADPSETVGMAFIQPGLRFMLNVELGFPLHRVGFLVNASETYTEGYGYRIENGTLRVHFTRYQIARDLYASSQNRYDRLAQRYVKSLFCEEALGMARDHITKAGAYYKVYNYSEAYSTILVAWAWATQTYSKTMSLIYDAAFVTIVFMALLMPFAFLIEQLVFHGRGWRRFATIAGVMAVLMIGFYFSNPSFSLMINTLFCVLGIGLEALFVVIAVFFISQAFREIRQKAIDLLGLHEFGRSRIEMGLSFFSISVENMKRRKLRTILLLITILASTTSILSLCSISYQMVIRVTALPHVASYDGILVKMGHSVPEETTSGVLDTPLYDYIKTICGDAAILFPRVWYYPETDAGTRGVEADFHSPSGNFSVKAFLGITPEESIWLTNNLGATQGRSFLEEDFYSCWVPEGLGIKPGETVSWDGVDLTVAGTFNPDAFAQIKELDNFIMSPMNPVNVEAISRRYVRTGVKPAPVDPSLVLIVPQTLALRLGGYIASISARFAGPISFEEIREIASVVASTASPTVFMGYGGQVFKCSALEVPAFIGGGSLAVVLVIGLANILVAMLGSVSERIPEISVYSSLGLSPVGMSTLFISEVAIHAVIGAVLGYFVGLTLNVLFISAGLLPSYFVLNYSSVSIVLALCSIVITVLASIAYPFAKVARLVTPSLERKWRITTRPSGDEWEIPLPYIAASPKDAQGILEYLHEYFDGRGKETRFAIIRKLEEPSHKEMELKLTASLLPLESHVNMMVTLRATKKKEKYELFLLINKLTGEFTAWKTLNYFFVDDIRKQVLLWRSIPPSMHERYIRRAELRRLNNE